ncbi:MAG: tRNA (guanosine(46)-N7)-methyltransferase TrmB [Clostridia bacterium]
MRVRNIQNASEQLNNFDRYLNNTNNMDNIELEIGMGKGEFLINKAITNPDKIFIGVELNISVLCLAMKKILKYEKDNNTYISNIYITSFDAITISEKFKENSINNIYLNFSDPWPKYKHRKRRLTYKTYIDEYLKVLKNDFKIYFKTDNRGLFESSIKSINNYPLIIEEIYLDLHKEKIDNIMTEYEKKFCLNGPIYMLVAKKSK